jgi:hypothetical protein
MPIVLKTSEFIWRYAVFAFISYVSIHLEISATVVRSAPEELPISESAPQGACGSAGGRSADDGQRLNDPGDGLENNGRHVLTYADLRACYRGVDGRPPTREIELHLTGNMERFIWGFNGQKFSSAKPIELKLGERIRIVLINDSMMEHPFTCTGCGANWKNGHCVFKPYKHTIT